MVGGGWPSSAGGRLVGSLAGLPYALAEAEQNFMIPAREQALIWGDLVPQLILTAKIPRWWNVTPGQMHWVGLHMRYAEALVAEAALDPEFAGTRARRALGRMAPPGRLRKVEDLLVAGPGSDRRSRTSRPCELFVVARQMLEREHDSGELRGRDIRQSRTGRARPRELRRHLARLRHAEAHAHEFLSPRTALSAHLPDADGLLQPHHGGELGIHVCSTAPRSPTKSTFRPRS